MAAIDLSEFEKHMPVKGPQCAVALAVAELRPADRAKLLAAIDAPAITAKAISRWCKERAVTISDFSVRRHRRQECGCDRSR